MNRRTGSALLVYLACVPAANWMIGHIGSVDFPGGPHTVPVGFGYSAPSGVLLIGLALAARDAVQRLAGRAWVLAAIVCGIALSYLVNPAIATASAVAFGLGELADFVVFTPLATWNLPVAVAVSGVVGGVIDTFVFLQIAFGSTDYWQGQVIGKTAVALTAGVLIWGVRRAVPVRLAAVES